MVSDFAFAPIGRIPRSVAAHASLPAEFIEAVAVSIEASPALAVSVAMSPAELRDAVRFAEAFTPIVAELELVARGFRYTILARLARAGKDALRTYNLAKGLNRPTDRAVLVPHIENMQRTLGRTRPRRSSSAVAATAAAGGAS